MMGLSTAISAGFILGVFAVAVWASRKPTQQSIVIATLTRMPDKDQT
jgi:hypothetical protein